MNFSCARFGKAADFSGRAFKERTDFRRTKFDAPPQFHNCTFFAETFFQGAEFPETRDNQPWRKVVNAKWWQPSVWLRRSKDNRAKMDKAAAEAESAYRSLEVQCGAIHSLNDELRFYGLALDARRANGGIRRAERWAAFFFKVFADYGRSIIRPLIWMFGVLAACALWLFAYLPHEKPAQEIWDAFLFALSRYVEPGKAGIDTTSPLASLSGSVVAQTIAYVQPVSLFVFGALSLIALRRRFQIRN